jgi:nucleoside-diphosphate-sugar epimerase
MSHVLVTGGCGFIGSKISECILAQGSQVTVFDNFSRSDRSYQNLSSSINVIQGDIRELSRYIAQFQNIDTIVHAAAINGTETFYSNPLAVLDVGIKGVDEVIKCTNLIDVSRVIFISSSEVYQSPHILPTPEEIPMIIPSVTNPRYSYALSKIYSEFLLTHASPTKFNLTIIRPHNVYGPNMGTKHVIPELFEKSFESLKKGDTAVKIKGDGKQSRSFIYIDDFIDAFTLIYNKHDKLETYNIGNPFEITIMNLANIIYEFVTGGKPSNILTSEPNVGETYRRVPDINKIKKLGFTPKTDIPTGIELMLKGFSDFNKY